METKALKTPRRKILALETDLKKLCGEENVLTDAVSKDFYASDLFEKGLEPDFIVVPGNIEQVAGLVTLASKHKRPIYIRGGGMSYSNTYLPARKAAIMVDTQKLTTIREVNTKDLYVTVEAGCTWKVLDQALEPHGLRAVFWGPFSGGKATIGGSMSQGTANNASARIGTSDSTALGYEIVTGAGDILVTGKDAQDGHKPFTRNYGPDMTSLFSNDAGAFGIKTAVTLKLESRPKAYGGVSFAFESFDAAIKAVKAGSQTGLASAVIAMDAETAGVRGGATGLKEDLKKLWAVVKSAHNPLLGFVRGVSVALAGRRVFERATFTAHFLAEGANDKILVAAERELRRVVKPFGSELPNIAISMMRLDNFPDLPMTSMDGRRMLPVHGILPWSQMPGYGEAYFKMMEGYKARLSELEITVADIFSAVGSSSLLCEPVFYWPDSYTNYQREMSSEFWTQNWKGAPDNPEARDLVAEVKTAIIDLQYEHGAAHIQIGKAYPYMRGRSEESLAFLTALKSELDPDNIINPGALGFKL